MATDIHDPDRDPVDVLAEEFADLLRRGGHPSVGAYAAAHPEYAEQLTELLPAVAQMELLKRFRGPAEQSLPDRLGDFRIVRELGRGGMGVVFEAVQESLGRPVALKVLARHAQLDQTQRERFAREAQAAARLHHTNVVPVFAVGEQDGLPYYAMQLIPGAGLHALVRRWRQQVGRDPRDHSETQALTPSTAPAGAPRARAAPAGAPDGPAYANWRFVAEVGMRAADALQYAHKQGVLHRDVKPANLILDGERVWVTDFGLAKVLNTDALTATGDILGTLQYLAPECLHGTADARSDVYGLGATLYELLTLEPPYAADAPAKVIKRVADSDPPAPRALNPAIPRDLETIVLTATAREPAARYASAGELARDLEAFLDDRPITARRQTLASRARRACRRNPAVASLIASTAAALALAAVTGWVGYARTTDALGREADRRRDAEAAKADADRATAEARELSRRLESNLRLSLGAFEQVFEAAGGGGQTGFGVPMPPPTARGYGKPGGPDGGPPDGTPLPVTDLATDKAAILEAILGFYDEFARQNAGQSGLDAPLRFEAAKASRRVCEANLWLKRPDKALPAFKRAVALLEPLAKERPTDEEVRTELALTYLSAPGDAHPDDREFPYRRAAEVAPRGTWLAGSVQFRLGWSREQNKDRPGAEGAYRDAVNAFAAVPAAKRPPNAHLELGFARFRLASVQTERGDYAAARETLERSADELRPFSFKPGGGPGGGRGWLWLTYLALADVSRAMGDDRSTTEATRNALQFALDGKGDKMGGPPPFGGLSGRPGAGAWGAGAWSFGPKKDWPGGPGKKDDRPGGPKKN
ncbi:MAG: protein kinase domain-containing protein [Gemmata sp.]